MLLIGVFGSCAVLVVSVFKEIIGNFCLSSQSYCYSEACFALLLLHRDCQGPFYGLAVKEKACLAFDDFFVLHKKAKF